MMHLVKNKVTEPVNLGSGSGISIKQIADIISKRFGREIKWLSDKPMGDKRRVFDTKRAEKYGFKTQISLEFGINDDHLAHELGDQYIKKCPLKTHVFPFTYEVLNYLKEKYHLHIITNGFEEVQYVKLRHSKLLHYFEQIITSEQVGVKKPNAEIFSHALVKASCKSNESIMIGDDLPVDILGAKAMGMYHV